MLSSTFPPPRASKIEAEHARSLPRRHLRALALAGAVFALAAAGCSKDEPAPSSSGTTTRAGTQPATGSTAVSMDADERIAQAKTIAVGFFEAQAVDDYDKASQRSSGAANLTIQWAQAVNNIKAATDSGYQVPPVTAPNVRVQIDALEETAAGTWVADGFVELSFRPGPVVSTTTTTAAPGTGPTTTAAPRPPSTFVVDLTFSGDGDNLKLDDYRLDDTPYPVSQLFMAMSDATGEADGLTGKLELAHRDLDGTVQYAGKVDNTGAGEATPDAAAFEPSQNGTSAKVAAADGQLFADPAPGSGAGNLLVVFPGLFPGGPGTVRVDYPAGGGTIPARALEMSVPDFPALTPRPVNTVPSTTVPPSSTTSSTSTSTTSTTGPTTTGVAPTVTVTVTQPATTTTAPASTTTAAPTTTVPSTTTTTLP